MTPAITLFIGLTTMLAAAFVLYVANVTYVARFRESSFPWWALVPVIAPVEAWKLGARARPIAFAIACAAYVLLQISAQAAG